MTVKHKNKNSITLAALVFIGLGGFFLAGVSTIQSETNRKKIELEYNNLRNYLTQKIEKYNNKN
jgi:CHASE1-domain containing sensor protein